MSSSHALVTRENMLAELLLEMHSYGITYFMAILGALCLLHLVWMQMFADGG